MADDLSAELGPGSPLGSEETPLRVSGTYGSTSVLSDLDGEERIAVGVRFLTYQNVVNSVLGYVFLTLLLRLLTPSEYGLYSSILLVITIGSSVAYVGLQSAATRFVAFFSRDGVLRAAFARSVVLLTLVFASAATAVLVLVSPALSLDFTRSTGSAWIFAASGVWLFSSSISGIFQGLVQGMRKYESLAKILVASNVAMVSFTAVGLLEFHSVLVPIVGWAVYGLVVTALSLGVTRGSLVGANPSGNSGATSQVLRYSLPLGIAGVLTVITGAGDPLLVGAFFNASQMGEYYAAIAISGGLGAILFTPLNTAFFPETSSRLNDPGKLSKGLRLAFRYTILALVPVSFALAALSRQVIGLYSGPHSAYFLATTSLQLLSVFFFFVAMQGILTTLLMSKGRSVQVMMIGVVTVLLDLLLSVTLVPPFGILGATASRILVDVAGMALAIVLTREFLRGVFDFRYLAKVLSASGVVFAVLYSLSTLVSHRPGTLLSYSAVGFGLFLLSARGLHIFDEADKRRAEHVTPGFLKKYVRVLL